MGCRIHVTREVARAGQAWTRHDPGAGTITLRKVRSEGGTLYAERDNALIGLETMETLAAAVKRAIEAQMHSA